MTMNSTDAENSTDHDPRHRHVIELRVAYQETDGQRRVHHANYLNYFERGRVEMLRAQGISYRQLEDTGVLLVVSEMRLQYHAAAEFDDILTLTTDVVEVRSVRIRHAYLIHRGDELIVAGGSTIAAVDPSGKPCRLPAVLRRLGKPTTRVS